MVYYLLWVCDKVAIGGLAWFFDKENQANTAKAKVITTDILKKKKKKKGKCSFSLAFLNVVSAINNPYWHKPHTQMFLFQIQFP